MQFSAYALSGTLIEAFCKGPVSSQKHTDMHVQPPAVASMHLTCSVPHLVELKPVDESFGWYHGRLGHLGDRERRTEVDHRVYREYDFNGQPEFVIDAQVFPGSSGSPVYIDLTFENFKNGQIVVGQRKLKLLGIVAMTMIRNNTLQAIPTGTNYFTQEVLGLGIVFKSTAIKELVDSMPLN